MRILPRDQIKEMIQYLADTYPKTFFLQPHLKRPLKKNILLDLERDRVLVDDDRREAAINFYTKDWDYQETLVAGAKRVDLHGHEVGSVTPQEQLEAQRKIKAQKDALREKRKAEGIKGPVEVARKLHADGKIPTDSLSKISAPRITASPPMTKAKTPEKTPEKTPQPDLARLRALWSNVDQVLSTEDADLRSALVAPALKVFVAEASKLIATLAGQGQ